MKVCLTLGRSLSQTLLFSVLPVLFDISIAIAVFYFVYGWLLAFIIGTVMFSYIFVSITLTTWRTKLRREMNDRDVITRGIHTDVLMNWETVKYFTSEARESTRYRSAVQAYQVKELQVVGSLNLLNLTQNFIITAGLLAGSLVVSYRITQGKADAAEFIVFITYLGQLYAPLHMLGMIYRQLNSGMVDAEKLLRLLEEETEIVDAPGAKDLVVTDGVIEFRDVHFSYDGKVKALDGVSFRIDKGTSVALVGESGSGKSTILRLLFRFYEIGSGAILIDNQDIRDVTQVSLRRALGVVPQESVLWNDTVEYNIGYGRQGASKEEIIEAAKAARLHDRIMSFPEREY
jgi:ABC-type transport system involved in Fe-S cluster assembly fused permease/ATPase subunit